MLNPYLFGGTSPTAAPNANLLSDNSFSNYNALQIEIRKRFSQGLTLNFNYTWSHSLTDRYNKNVDNSSNFATLRNRALDRGPSPFDLRHVIQAFGTYSLPFGKGRKFAINNPIFNAVRHCRSIRPDPLCYGSQCRLLEHASLLGWAPWARTG